MLKPDQAKTNDSESLLAIFGQLKVTPIPRDSSAVFELGPSLACSTHLEKSKITLCPPASTSLLLSSLINYSLQPL